MPNKKFIEFKFCRFGGGGSLLPLPIDLGGKGAYLVHRAYHSPSISMTHSQWVLYVSEWIITVMSQHFLQGDPAVSLGILYGHWWFIALENASVNGEQDSSSYHWETNGLRLHGNSI